MIDLEPFKDIARLRECGGWIEEPEGLIETVPLPGPETEYSTLWPDGLLIKSKWGRGPWILEPDLVVFRARSCFQHYRCAVWRHPSFGQLNGYVVVPSGHPAHGAAYEAVQNLGVRGHRGLTWGTGTPNGNWIVGFHTGHAWDYQPALEARGGHMRWPRTEPGADVEWHARHTYADLAYVRDEVEKTAADLAALEGSG